MTRVVARVAVLAALVLAAACAPRDQRPGEIVLTFPASAVGAEAVVLERQLERFMREHPGVRVISISASS